MGIVACEQMRMKWLHYEIAFVNWLMKKAGSKSAGNNGVMATVKNTLIEKEKKKHVFIVLEEVLRQFFKCL